MVYGPTAYDEVRCELRTALSDSSPTLDRCALRTSGKLRIATLRKYVRAQLQLDGDDDVALRYDGRDMDDDATTLGELQDEQDGDKSDGDRMMDENENGHLIVEYEVTKKMNMSKRKENESVDVDMNDKMMMMTMKTRLSASKKRYV